jgi:hypothetical protein
MGRNKPGTSKPNPIFKVLGGKAGKVKGKTQEVATRLKHVRVNLFITVADLHPSYKKFIN